MKEDKAWISALIPTELKMWLQEEAEREDRSVNNYLERLIRDKRERTKHRRI